MTALFVDAWYRRFGTAPVNVYKALDEVILEDEAFLDVVMSLEPDGWRPRVLTMWFIHHEHELVRDSQDRQFRFARYGGSSKVWRLRPARDFLETRLPQVEATA